MGTVSSQNLSSQLKTLSFPHTAVTMLLPTVTVLAVLASSVSAHPESQEDKQIPNFLPLDFLLADNNASTCQALCKMTPECQYFVFQDRSSPSEGLISGSCSFGKRPITTALKADNFYSGTPDGPVLPNILALSDIQMILFNDDTVNHDCQRECFNLPYGEPCDVEGCISSHHPEQCYRLCLDTEDCHHWYVGFTDEMIQDVHDPDVYWPLTTEWCYLDSRKDLIGNMMMYIHGEGGDRNTPPSEPTPPQYPSDADIDIPVYDIAEGAKKTQKQQTTEKPQNTTKKPRPSNPGTKLTQDLFGKKM